MSSPLHPRDRADVGRAAAAVDPAVSPADPPAARSGHRAWPWWGVAAGVLGTVATVVLDVRPEAENAAYAAGVDRYLVSAADMDTLDQGALKLSYLLGFAAVAALVVLQASWRRHVEQRLTGSVAARVVSAGLLVTAAGLALAYGWKGALANYMKGGPEQGMFDDQGLYVYYMLTDFGPYLPWLGTLLSFGALAWLSLRHRLVHPVLGGLCALYTLGIAAGFAVLGVPGLAGPLGGAFLAFVCGWLALAGGRLTR